MNRPVSGPTREFWQSRFESRNTPWDRGEANPQLHAWLAGGALRPCRILVPGCGSGYEVAVLAAAGFDVTAIDYAPAAVASTRGRLAASGLHADLVEGDALAWMPAQRFDAIYEQTCLAALHPDDWHAYADRIDLFVQILRPGAVDGVVHGPPYHCDVNAMRALFPSSRWHWPKPPYPRVAHPMNFSELAVVLEHREPT